MDKVTRDSQTPSLLVLFVQWSTVCPQVWADRPSKPLSPATVYPVSLAGQSSAEKVAAVREAMVAEKAGALVVSALDELAWLFNIRGTDVDYNPVW